MQQPQTTHAVGVQLGLGVAVFFSQKWSSMSHKNYVLSNKY